MALHIIHSSISMDATDNTIPHNIATASYTFPATVLPGDVLILAQMHPDSAGDWADGASGNNYFGTTSPFQSSSTMLFWWKRVCDGSEGGTTFSFVVNGPGTEHKIGLIGWLIRGGTYASSTDADDANSNTGSFISPLVDTVAGAGSTSTDVVDLWASAFQYYNGTLGTTDPAANDAGLSMLQASAVARDSGQPFTPYSPGHFAGAALVGGLSGSVDWTNSGTATGGAFTQENTESARVRIVFSGVTPDLDVAFSAVPVAGPNPLTVEFTDETAGSPVSWTWYFGDGETSTDQNPTHVYHGEGSYDVTLVVTA